MKVWLDDQWDTHPERKPPDGWTPAKTAQEAIKLLKTGTVEMISLDHDLGPETAGNGYQVAMWIEEAAHSGKIPALTWYIHTKNNVGRLNMRRALENADIYWAMRDGS